MKKILLVLVVVGLSTQAYSQAQVAIGLKAGINSSKFDASESDNIVGFHAGAFTLFKFAMFGIQPELLYSQQGSKFSDIQFDELKTSYVTIPVMAKFYLFPGFNIQAGPQFGFLTMAEVDGDDAKDFMSSSDITANVGLGADLPFGLTIDARYNFGITDANDDSTYDGSLKSRVFQFSVGYKIFKFGK